jgi:CubicO group peptidase (beta-lactamase class C family)
MTVVNPLDNVSGFTTSWSAFGLVATPLDVARWGRALFTGDILNEDMTGEMLQFAPAAGNIPIESGVGLGIRRYLYNDGVQWGHSGAFREGSSIFVFDPESGVTVSLAMNQSSNLHHASHFYLIEDLLAIATQE